jgi:hypothetical protein
MGDVFCLVSVVLTLVRLAKKEEGIFEKDEITAAGLEDRYEPILILAPPAPERINRIIGSIDGCLDQGKVAYL